MLGRFSGSIKFNCLFISLLYCQITVLIFFLSAIVLFHSLISACKAIALEVSCQIIFLERFKLLSEQDMQTVYPCRLLSINRVNLS